MVKIATILKKIESTPQYKLEEIMGVKNYIDTPGFCHNNSELKNYHGVVDCMKQNMGAIGFKKLLSWIKNNPNKVKQILK